MPNGCGGTCGCASGESCSLGYCVNPNVCVPKCRLPQVCVNGECQAMPEIDYAFFVV
jgi:hypothetical protein